MKSEMGSELVTMVEEASLSPAGASAKLLDRLLHQP
jgi:hypothetical protein